MENKTVKVMLYSGGMDSWLIDKLWKPDLRIYVDMHTKYSEEEIKKIKLLKDDVKIVDFPLGQYERDDAIIPLRNLYLIMVACNETLSDNVEICVGATAGDRSLDQSETFFNKAMDILNYLYSPQHWVPNGKNIKVITDYRNKTKAELLKMYMDQGGSIDKAFKESLSCYNPSEDLEECWNCKSCFRKFIAFAYNGYEFDKDVLAKNLKYFNEHIKEEMDSKEIYRTPKEDEEIRTVITNSKKRLEE